MSEDRKTRGDSVLDTGLTGAEQDAFFAYCEGNTELGGHTLIEAARWLRANREIDLSENSISKWLARRRKEAKDFQFYSYLAEVRKDAERAEAFGEQVSALQVEGITQANVAMLSQAMFRASREKNEAALGFFTELLSKLMAAVAKHRASTAAQISAETGRDRFQFDAAKRALAQAAALQQITQSGGHEREKIERAVQTIFGRRPAGLSSSPSAGESDESGGSATETNFSGEEVAR